MDADREMLLSTEENEMQRKKLMEKESALILRENIIDKFNGMKGQVSIKKKLIVIIMIIKKDVYLKKKKEAILHEYKNKTPMTMVVP